MRWFEGLSSKGIRPGLENISTLLDDLGSPQKGLRTIHVAGSDGKGSVCCMLESILSAAGFKVGMFTSPHIIRVNESIRIGGKDISDGELEKLLSDVRESYESTGCGCTSFEVLTACALTAFRRGCVDVAIVEVGMGGRLDATNVVEPEVTVINNISLEHTAYLGPTIREISYEKAGIMKPGIPCVTMNVGDALDVIRERSEELGCPLTCVDPEDLDILRKDAGSLLIRYCSKTYCVGLPGGFQGRNAALAIETVRAMRDHEHIEHFIGIGLETAEWPCRMQKIAGLPLTVDVTHTKKGAEYLMRDVGDLYGKVTLVTAMLSDKDLEGVAELLSRIAVRVYVSAPDSPRAADKDQLASFYRRYHDDVTVFDTVGDAVETALKNEEMVLVTGSFRTAEDCLRWLGTR